MAHPDKWTTRTIGPPGQMAHLDKWTSVLTRTNGSQTKVLRTNVTQTLKIVKTPKIVEEITDPPPKKVIFYLYNIVSVHIN